MNEWQTHVRSLCPGVQKMSTTWVIEKRGPCLELTGENHEQLPSERASGMINNSDEVIAVDHDFVDKVALARPLKLDWKASLWHRCRKMEDCCIHDCSLCTSVQVLCSLTQEIAPTFDTLDGK